MIAGDGIRFLYHALRMKLDAGYRVPFSVLLNLLNECPFACRYCSVSEQASARLPLDLVRAILRDIRQLGGRRVHLSGGEPLLRDDFGAIVRCAKDLGLFVSLTTSGFRVEEQIEALRCADQVQISFDGPEAVRIALCGEECARVAARAVDVLERHGVPFWTVTVLTKLNLAHIDWVVDHARQHGILANFVAMDRQAETWNEANPMPPAARELLPAGDELRAAFRRLIALKQAGAPIGSSMPYLREVLDWEDYGETLSPRRSRRYRCVAWQSQCELLANGELHVCDWTRRRGMGVSVRAYGFKGAWERLPRPADCRSCLTSCALEPNLILSLNPGAVLNWGRRLIRFPVAGGSPP